MRRLLCLPLAVACLVASAATAADLKPDGNAPVFRIFASDSGEGGAKSPINIAGKQPLLIVSRVANVQVSTDRKAVRLTLTGADARRFADITRKHANRLLILESDGKVLEAMQVGGAVTNGVLDFTYPDDAAVADYLKKRFRLK